MTVPQTPRRYAVGMGTASALEVNISASVSKVSRAMPASSRSARKDEHGLTRRPVSTYPFYYYNEQKKCLFIIYYRKTENLMCFFNEATDTAHAKRTECSNMGICDTATGACTCAEGFAGDACQYIKCPVKGTCSGHGICRRTAEMGIQKTCFPII